MILEQIKPVTVNVFDCFLSTIIPVAVVLGKNFELMFADSWIFDFKKKATDTESLGNRLITSKSNSKDIYMLNHYHGINIIKNDVNSFNDLLSIIENEMSKGMPVSIYIDTYYCPWTKLYKKYSMDHYCLVIGMDTDLQQLNCIDPYMTEKIETLPFDDLSKGFAKCFSFINMGSNEVIIDWSTILINAISNVSSLEYNENSFSKMRSFANEILLSNNFIKEVQESDLYSCTLFIKLRQICYSRINFSWSIRYISDKCSIPELLQIAKKMEECGDLWRIIWMKISKLAYINDNDVIHSSLLSISDAINKVADFEEKICDDILRLVNCIKN